jgi:hypothetical protein
MANASKQRPAVRHRDRIRIHVHHAGRWVHGLRRLVDGPARGKPRAQVEELSNPGRDEEPHDALLELPSRPHNRR